MTRTWIYLIILTVSVLFAAGTAQADIPDWHKPIPCSGCHQETLGASAGPGECGNCHNYKLPDNTINMPLMQEEHNPRICTACHIGNTLVDGEKKEIFHNAHNSVQCSSCHLADNSTVVKIEEGKAFQCTSCHGNQIHGIHVRNLDRACPICHGSWAEGKLYRGDNTSYSSAGIQENTGVEQFTIFSFIKSLFKNLFGSLSGAR